MSQTSPLFDIFRLFVFHILERMSCTLYHFLLMLSLRVSLWLIYPCVSESALENFSDFSAIFLTVIASFFSLCFNHFNLVINCLILFSG